MSNYRIISGFLISVFIVFLKICLCQAQDSNQNTISNIIEKAELKETKLDIKDIKVYNNQGLIFFRARNYEKAIENFEKVVKLQSRSYSARYNLGIALYKNKEIQKASSEFRKVLKLKPDHLKAQNMVNRIERVVDLSALPEVLRIPVIYYDFKSDKSNPNFEMRGGLVQGKVVGVKGSSITVSVKNRRKEYVLTPETRIYGRKGKTSKEVSKKTLMDKEIRFHLNPKNQKEILVIEDPSSGYRMNIKSTKGMVNSYLSEDRKPVLKYYNQRQGNFLFNEWYLPSGIKGTDAKFKYMPMYDMWMWEGLKPYKDRQNEFVGKNYNDNDLMANVIIYDYLEFKLMEVSRSDSVLGKKEMNEKIKKIISTEKKKRKEAEKKKKKKKKSEHKKEYIDYLPTPFDLVEFDSGQMRKIEKIRSYRSYMYLKTKYDSLKGKFSPAKKRIEKEFKKKGEELKKNILKSDILTEDQKTALDKGGESLEKEKKKKVKEEEKRKKEEEKKWEKELKEKLEKEFKEKKKDSNESIEKKVVYLFDDQDFFNVDGIGFKEEKIHKKNHNYGYTMEMHTKFLYRGGEYFDFRGDDDIYLFIDNKLVMDLGGLHPARSATVELDKIPGLKKGRVYPFDLFFAERQSPHSSLRIEGTFRFTEPQPAVVGIEADRDIFIPENDEKVKIMIMGNKIEHRYWELTIQNNDDVIIRTFEGRGKMKGFIIWDGRDDDGNRVEAGEQFRILCNGIDPIGQGWESNEEQVRSEIKLDVGAAIVERAIYFEPFLYSLQPESKMALDRIFFLLNYEPSLKLLIKGNVASFGGWTQNKLIELSRQRAESVKQYLVDAGIDPERLKVKGYGDTRPFSDDKSEAGVAKNRRTEFEIISID